MTTITIDLPDDIAAALAAKASEWKTSVGELLTGAAINLVEEDDDGSWHPSLTPDDIAAIKEGMAQAKRGEVYSLEEVLSTLDQVP
jgi:predicted transcriptional regulator